MARKPLPIAGEPPVAGSYGPWWSPKGVLWATGFRSMFLLGALFGLSSVLIWVLLITSTITLDSHLPSITWHAHELLFGYTLAIIAGFLTTAVPKWTKQPATTAGAMMTLTGLWVLGRVAMCSPGPIPDWLVVLLDASFLPALTVVIGGQIWRSRNRRNYVVPVLLFVMSIANILIHVTHLRGISLPTRLLSVSVDVAMLFMLLIANRIIPLFTRNKTGADVVIRPKLSKLSLGLALGLLGSDLVGAPAELTGALALSTAAAALFQARGWRTGATLRIPMLWVLHVGYGWILLALLFKGVSVWSSMVTPSIATHAMTAGAIGTLTIGMMSRVSLGHTGRVIVASPAVATAFALMIIGGAVRVFGLIFVPQAAITIYTVSGSLWASSLLIYLVVYWPILTSTRTDGRAG